MAKTILQSPLDKNALHHSQKRRKSWRWLWITLSIILLLGISGVLLLNFTVNPMLAEEEYYIALRNQDYAKAYSYLGSSMQAKLTLEAFTQQAQEQDNTAGKITTYTESYPFGDPANITATIKRANGATYTAHIEMRQEGGHWKVTSFDRI